MLTESHLVAEYTIRRVFFTNRATDQQQIAKENPCLAEQIRSKQRK